MICLRRGDRLFQDNKKAKSLLEGLVKKYRTLRWAYLDISQYMFSMKSQLPADLVSGKVWLISVAFGEQTNNPATGW